MVCITAFPVVVWCLSSEKCTNVFWGSSQENNKYDRVSSSVSIKRWFLDFRFVARSSLRTKRVTRAVCRGEGGGGQCSVGTLCTRNQTALVNV